MQPSWTKAWFGDEKPKLIESDYGTPVRLAVIWTPAVLNTPGQPPTRGFGGRLYFYDAKNQPIAVEGQLVVYAYDDSQQDSPPRSMAGPMASRAPDRKYAFTPEQFTTHFSPTDLGASYSVWVPWDAVGQPQADISLVPIFTATSGQLVVGQASKNLLPGPKTAETRPRLERFALPPPQINRVVPEDASPPQFGVQQASFEQSPASPSAATPSSDVAGVETLSINLPGSLAERLASAGPQATMSEQLARHKAALTAQASILAAMQSAAVQQAASEAATATTAGNPQPPGAIPPPWSPPDPRQARFARPRLPVRGGLSLPPTPGQTLTPPFHAGSPSVPASPPGSAPASAGPGASSAGLQTSR
jgi:hypothetical protein